LAESCDAFYEDDEHRACRDIDDQCATLLSVLREVVVSRQPANEGSGDATRHATPHDDRSLQAALADDGLAGRTLRAEIEGCQPRPAAGAELGARWRPASDKA
jgi:hypothetical protein